MFLIVLLASLIGSLILSVYIGFAFNVDTFHITTVIAILILAVGCIMLIFRQRVYTCLTFHRFINKRNSLQPIRDNDVMWPKVFFAINHKDNIRVFYIKDNGSTSAQLLIEEVEALSRAYKTVILEKSIVRDGMIITMELKRQPQITMKIQDIHDNNSSTVTISRGIQWNLADNPHGIIVGRTGEGKSVLARMIIKSLSDTFSIYYLDPKNSYKTRQSLIGSSVKYYSKATDIIETMQSLNREMIARGDAMSTFPSMKEEFQNKDFSKILIVFDEMGAVSAMPDMPKNGYDEIMKALRSILFQGREANIHVLALCQRADSKNFGDGAVRGQFSLRCAMGAIQDKEAYQMVFPDTEYVSLTRHEKGAGLVWIPQYSRPREFVIPRFVDLDKPIER